MIKFSGNIFMLGCGSITQCALPLLLKHLDIDPKRITIMDFVDNKKRVADELKKGVRYIVKRLTKDNYKEILGEHLKAGDLFIDLSWNVDTISLIDWCHHNGVMFLNSAVEMWECPNSPSVDPREQTLYPRQMALYELAKSWKEKGPTAVIDHGANPGLVSHLTKLGLIDLANHFLKEKSSDKRSEAIKKARDEENFPELARLLDVKTIHIAERDTQITDKPKRVNEFVNTWSVAGLIEEGLAPAELGWGTHEKRLPKGGYEHENGPKNQICIAQKGSKTWVQSWVPSGPITGMVIRHGEAFSISNHLTVWKDGKAIYRPTVHYAYCPCDGAINSLHELEMRHFDPQKDFRILNDEITSGLDELGCLLMGHDFGGWWIGSILDIEESRRLVPHQSATTVQVAIALVAAAVHIINHPNEGFCQPDDLNYKEILEVAMPYLGKFVSMPVDWSPLTYAKEMSDFGQKLPKEEDKWQFTTFLIPPQIQ
jgi:homospermidine synthase